jgi:hypothetical protein
VLIEGVRFYPLVCALAFAGCGFQGFSGGDGGNPPPGSDLAGTTGGIGRGPLGALPAGFCCSSNEMCQSRRCINLGTGPYYCSPLCADDLDCNQYGLFHCDTANQLCAPVNDPYTCVDESNYHYGSRPTGACCQPGNHGGEPCQGGICISTGNPANPFYCTQGCNDKTPCPGGYTCYASPQFLTDLRNCWKDPTANDDTASISCQ